MKPSELRKVEKAAAKAASSRLALESAMREAHASGQSLRLIAAAAGLSHEKVRRVVSLSEYFDNPGGPYGHTEDPLKDAFG